MWGSCWAYLGMLACTIRLGLAFTYEIGSVLRHGLVVGVAGMVGFEWCEALFPGFY